MFAALRRWTLMTLLLTAVVWAGDYFSVRFPGSRNPLGTITIQPYYAIRLKNKRTEFDFDVPPQTKTCVHSLFPHLGFTPCWYEERQKDPRIDD